MKPTKTLHTKSIFLGLLFVAFLQSNVNAQQELAIEKADKKLPLKGESFKLNGNDAFIILPAEVGEAIPWVWYAPTLKGLPAQSEVWMFERFLKAGIAIAGIDVGESYGSPKGRAKYDQLYQYLTSKKNFSKKPCLLARSRGGLMLYSWATENPDSVSGIAGIYPVCNIASYPGLERACGAYEMTADQLETNLKKFNPIDKLQSLAKAKVPIFHIQGDSDRIVPLEKNSGIVAERYKELGGSMELEVVKGQGHNMWDGWFTSQRLVDFVLKHVDGSSSSAESKPTEHPIPASDLWLTYSAKVGPGNGKHIVLIAADQEYRSEQTMPMLARILAERHGFHCTVLFCVNEKGEVDPTLEAPFKDKSKRHRLPGLQHLAKADGLIWLSRFMQLNDEDIAHFHNYFDSGKPMIALRTANHGFWGGKAYKKGGKRVSLREMLGGTFMGHHGGWHRESTRGQIIKEQQDHPILKGVTDIWGPSDVYRCHNEKNPMPTDCTALVLGQPLIDLNPKSPPNEKKEPLPVAWTKSWKGNNGKTSRIFHFTMGSARDFESEGVRRMTINAVYWGLNMESKIKADSSVDYVGEYKPLKSGFNYEKLGVKPRKPAFYK